MNSEDRNLYDCSSLGEGEWLQRWITKGQEKVLEMMTVQYLWLWVWFHRCIHMSKFIKSCILNMCSLLYINIVDDNNDSDDKLIQDLIF